MEILETREVFTILTVLWFCVMSFFHLPAGTGYDSSVRTGDEGCGERYRDSFLYG